MTDSTDSGTRRRPSITPGDMVRLTAQVVARDTAGGDPVTLDPTTPLMYLGLNDPSDMGDTLALVMGSNRIMEVHPHRLRRAD